MLLLDVSNIMYTRASAKAHRFGEAGEFNIRSIPYFLEKIASYYSEDTEMIAVFERVGKIPALARTSGYKSGRNRNPQVEWEIESLRKLLQSVGFPIYYIDGQEADYVIANYCRINRDKENISILSADQDLAANVRSGDYVTKMLSYSTVSYNIDKNNFKEITGVEYNFMNIHKILLGCSSDKIKPLSGGEEIYKAFIGNLESLWKRKYGYNPNEQSPSDFFDEVIIPYTEFDYFLSWYNTSKFYEPSMVNELYNRKQLIEGPVFDLPRLPKVDWHSYNDLVASMNFSTIGEVKSQRRGKYTEEMYKNIVSILRTSKTVTTTMFEGAAKPLDDLETVGDITNILGILNTGGEL